MLMTMYSFLLTLALVVSAPWWLWRMATSGRYREGLRQRLGFVPDSLKAAVAGLPAKKTVWVHAVSVGEVLAVERLVAELRVALPGYVVAISTTTATGQKLAREHFTDCPVFYFPLDFAFAARAYLRVLRPALMVLVESEFWPRHLVECERAGVPVAVVNARVSDRSFPRYMRLRWLWKPLLGKVSLFLAQGEESAERLRAIGAPSERIRVSGNLKYDVPGGGDNATVRAVGSQMWQSRLLVAGSTHQGEEEALLNVWPELLRAVPDATLMIAPRHQQRFDEVWELMRQKKTACIRCSYLLSHVEPLFGGVVTLLDSIGDLAPMYGIASAAFVGGSLVPKGGQNPLEAARYGIPVVMGSSFENFREVVEKLRDEGAVNIVEGGELAHALIAAMQTLPRGQKHFEGLTGATRKTVDDLVGLVRGPA